MSTSSKGLHGRASRLLQGNDGRPSTTSSSGARRPLGESLRSKYLIHMWQRAVTLATMFLQFIQVKNFLLGKMPKETIDPSSSDSEYEKIPVPGEAPKKKGDKSQPWTVHKHKGIPFIVGPVMGPGLGVVDQSKITHSPLLCQHPSDKMCARGGRGTPPTLWWYCEACGNRWQRIPLSNYESAGTVSSGNDILCFGKHIGKTCRTVYGKHPEYCQWILKTAETGDSPCQELLKFARYISSRDPNGPNPEDIPAGRMDEEL